MRDVGCLQQGGLSRAGGVAVPSSKTETGLSVRTVTSLFNVHCK